VYDLLTLKMVWSQGAERFTAFAVAGSEDLLPAAHPDAWIAVTLSTKDSSRHAGADGDATDGEETLVSSPLHASSGPAEHKVLLFSPFSGTPLLSRALPTKASSLVFCSESREGEKKSEGTGRGLAIATESCEMLFLTTGGDNAQNNGTIRQLAGTVGEQSATVSSSG
jgi:hypothetical protein